MSFLVVDETRNNKTAKAFAFISPFSMLKTVLQCKMTCADFQHNCFPYEMAVVATPTVFTKNETIFSVTRKLFDKKTKTNLGRISTEIRKIWTKKKTMFGFSRFFGVAMQAQFLLHRHFTRCRNK